MFDTLKKKIFGEKPKSSCSYVHQPFDFGTDEEDDDDYYGRSNVNKYGYTPEEMDFIFSNDDENF